MSDKTIAGGLHRSLRAVEAVDQKGDQVARAYRRPETWVVEARELPSPRLEGMILENHLNSFLLEYEGFTFSVARDDDGWFSHPHGKDKEGPYPGGPLLPDLLHQIKEWVAVRAVVRSGSEKELIEMLKTETTKEAKAQQALRDHEAHRERAKDLTEGIAAECKKLQAERDAARNSLEACRRQRVEAQQRLLIKDQEAAEMRCSLRAEQKSHEATKLKLEACRRASERRLRNLQDAHNEIHGLREAAERQKYSLQRHHPVEGEILTPESAKRYLDTACADVEKLKEWLQEHAPEQLKNTIFMGPFRVMVGPFELVGGEPEEPEVVDLIPVTGRDEAFRRAVEGFERDMEKGFEIPKDLMGKPVETSREVHVPDGNRMGMKTMLEHLGPMRPEEGFSDPLEEVIWLKNQNEALSDMLEDARWELSEVDRIIETPAEPHQLRGEQRWKALQRWEQRWKALQRLVGVAKKAQKAVDSWEGVQEQADRIVTEEHETVGDLMDAMEEVGKANSTDGLSFAALRRANLERVGQFKNAHGDPAHSDPQGFDWSREQWLEAALGELGEYANFSKKYRRGDISEEEFVMHAKKELADTVTYLDLLANRLGIDLGEATREKFNEVSRRIGVEVWL